jgi:hypothetical protein
MNQFKFKIKLSRIQIKNLAYLLADRSMFEGDDFFCLTWTMRYALAKKLASWYIDGKKEANLTLDISQCYMISQIAKHHDIEDYILLIDEINQIDQQLSNVVSTNLRTLINEPLNSN